MIFDSIISTYDTTFTLLASCNGTCQLIIINGGGGEGALGALKAVISASPGNEGLSDMVSSLSNAASSLYSGTHSYVSGLSLPTVSGELDDQEKALAWCVELQGMINAISNGAASVAGEDGPTICGCLSDCTVSLLSAAQDFTGYS